LHHTHTHTHANHLPLAGVTHRNFVLSESNSFTVPVATPIDKIKQK